jgi:hypothetical protein
MEIGMGILLVNWDFIFYFNQIISILFSIMQQNIEQEIVNKLGQPAELESLYQAQPSEFKRAFFVVFESFKDQPVAQVWFHRLTYTSHKSPFGNQKDWMMLGIFALVSAFLMQFPRIFHFSNDFYYPRNIAFVSFPLIAIFFARNQRFPSTNFSISLALIAFSACYINLLPNLPTSNTLILACIHLPILVWSLVGLNYLGKDWKSSFHRMNFLRYNGDFLIMTAILLLAGGLFSALSVGMFKLIDVSIENWYFDYFVLSTLPSVPILATFLVENNPQLVNKISPIIAKIFTPLVFLTLLGFLFALLFTGKDPYNDRDFLLVFNVILIGVMALIFFSVSEASKEPMSPFQLYTLTGLALLAIINNVIAVTAIVFRLFEFGITPNRISVLGSNILIMINLIWVGKSLMLICQGKGLVSQLENSLTRLLPFFVVWAMVVIFILPFIFQFK